MYELKSDDGIDPEKKRNSQEPTQERTPIAIDTVGEMSIGNFPGDADILKGIRVIDIPKRIGQDSARCQSIEHKQGPLLTQYFLENGFQMQLLNPFMLKIMYDAKYKIPPFSVPLRH